MYNHGYTNCSCKGYPQYCNCNRYRCGFNRCNCGINTCYDSDILTLLLFRQVIRNMNCCCRVSPYA